MNKRVFILLLFLTLSSCGKFENFLKNVSKGIDQVSKTTEKIADIAQKTSQTIGVASSLISGIVADSKVVTEEVKKLGTTLQSYFNNIINNIQKIIDNSRKFAEAAYTDGDKLYKDLKKQLDMNIAAAQADIKISLESAKNVLGQFGSDVSLVYKDGKLIIKEATDAANLKQVISDVKAKNKENLEAAVESVNSAIEKATALVETSKDYLTAYKAIAENTAYDAKTKAEKIIKNLKEYITKAETSLNKFVASEKKGLEQILKDAEALAKSSKSMVEQITSTINNVAGVVEKNAININSGVNEVKDIWNTKKSSEASTAAADDDDEQSSVDPIEKIKKSAEEIKNNFENSKTTVREATNTINETTEEIKNAVNDVKNKIVNLQYSVSATKLNVRSGPATTYGTVGSLSKGEIVTVYEVNGTWARIGTNKWCSMKYLKVTNSEAANAIAATKESVTKALESLKSILAMF